MIVENSYLLLGKVVQPPLLEMFKGHVDVVPGKWL